MGNTKIEWCDRSWPVVLGCTKCSPGCDRCFGESMARRLAGMARAERSRGRNPGQKVLYERVVSGRRWNGSVICNESVLTQPLRWRMPCMIFPASTSDIFHPKVPFDFLDRIFAVMALCPQHTFYLLTKRSDRARQYCEDSIARGYLVGQEIERFGKLPQQHSAYWSDAVGRQMEESMFCWPLPNVWLGCTAENQEQTDKRIPILLATPAAKRFVSVEPMLERVQLAYTDTGEDMSPSERREWGLPATILQPFGSPPGTKLDWVICGCESGPGARPMDIAWVRDLRDQCVAAGTPFFLKQMMVDGKLTKMPALDGRVWDQRPEAKP